MKKNIYCILFAVMMLVLAACGGGNGDNTQTTTYSNPVYAPVFADPCVIRHNGVYYAYATEDYGLWRKDNDPLNDVMNVQCVPILSSTDLIDWKFEGSVFKGLSKPTWGADGAFVWAPDIVKVGDKFLLYYALAFWGATNPGVGVASADHPAGPWTDHGKLFRSEEIGVDNSIDPAVFYGDDNRLYMIWGSFRGLFGIELTADGLGLKGGLDAAKRDKVLLAGIVGNWDGATYEAPYVVRRDGYYYMFVSSGTCCDGFNSSYHVRVARSENPLGPYVDDNGASMLARSKGKVVVENGDRFVGVGHNAIAEDDAGNQFLVYHGFDTSKSPGYGQAQNARSLLIDKIVWKGGWPEVEGKKAGESGMISPVISK